jgi:glycosyltransferase involved in cell wall biosynthesis
MISVLILTLNEEENLAACLDSIGWCDDILVVDSFSTDRTLDIAERRGCRLLQRRFDSFASQRNFGLEKGNWKHDWVLHLDADEVVTPDLRDELLRTARGGAKDAYRLASKMMFQGRWLKHSGMYPCYQVRFGRRDKLRFVQVGHGQREALPGEALGTLREPLLHYSFSKGLDDWFEKHNRYSTQEAQHQIAGGPTKRLPLGSFGSRDPVVRWRAMKELSSRLPARPLFRFLYLFFFRLGFLDGIPGFHYSVLVSIYDYMIVAKTDELKRKSKDKS